MSYALYAFELIDQFTAEAIENRPLFQLLLQTLENLCQCNNMALVLRYFELQLLNAVGYRPQLQSCVSCQKKLEPVTNYFYSNFGGMLCQDCRQEQFFTYSLSVNGLKVLRLLQDCDYSMVNKLKLDPSLFFEMERVLWYYLRFLLERELKSITWINALREELHVN
jgi:DNA repair protein RecO (recombination protein O)